MACGVPTPLTHTCHISNGLDSWDDGKDRNTASLQAVNESPEGQQGLPKETSPFLPLHSSPPEGGGANHAHLLAGHKSVCWDFESNSKLTFENAKTK